MLVVFYTLGTPGSNGSLNKCEFWLVNLFEHLLHHVM